MVNFKIKNLMKVFLLSLPFFVSNSFPTLPGVIQAVLVGSGVMPSPQQIALIHNVGNPGGLDAIADMIVGDLKFAPIAKPILDSSEISLEARERFRERLGIALFSHPEEPIPGMIRVGSSPFPVTSQVSNPSSGNSVQRIAQNRDLGLKNLASAVKPASSGLGTLLGASVNTGDAHQVMPVRVQLPPEDFVQPKLESPASLQPDVKRAAPEAGLRTLSAAPSAETSAAFVAPAAPVAPVAPAPLKERILPPVDLIDSTPQQVRPLHEGPGISPSFSVSTEPTLPVRLEKEPHPGIINIIPQPTPLVPVGRTIPEVEALPGLRSPAKSAPIEKKVDTEAGLRVLSAAPSAEISSKIKARDIRTDDLFPAALTKVRPLLEERTLELFDRPDLTGVNNTVLKHEKRVVGADSSLPKALIPSHGSFVDMVPQATPMLRLEDPAKLPEEYHAPVDRLIVEPLTERRALPRPVDIADLIARDVAEKPAESRAKEPSVVRGGLSNAIEEASRNIGNNEEVLPQEDIAAEEQSPNFRPVEKMPYSEDEARPYFNRDFLGDKNLRKPEDLAASTNSDLNGDATPSIDGETTPKDFIGFDDSLEDDSLGSSHNSLIKDKIDNPLEKALKGIENVVKKVSDEIYRKSEPDFINVYPAKGSLPKDFWEYHFKEDLTKQEVPIENDKFLKRLLMMLLLLGINVFFRYTLFTKIKLLSSLHDFTKDVFITVVKFIKTIFFGG